MGHLAAGLRAGVAGFGAFLAMIDAMLAAFGGAGVADLGAKRADLGRELGAAGHLPRGEGAEIGAAAIDFDAAGHHVHVGFAEAGGGAAFAGVDTALAGLDAVVEGKVVHGGEQQGGLIGRRRGRPVSTAGSGVANVPFLAGRGVRLHRRTVPRGVGGMTYAGRSAGRRGS